MPKIIFKAGWLGVVIIIIPFEKPENEVDIFDRTTLSGFAMRKFTTKLDFNTKKQALLLIKLRSIFCEENLHTNNICCIQAKCFLFLN